MSLLKTMGIALVAGGGAILTLGGFLDFDAEGVKKNIKTLLSISDDVGGKAEFFLEGGHSSYDVRYRLVLQSLVQVVHCRII
nr:MAG: hypothetical protein CM15mV30_1820 [uncultured marine virus]